MFDKILNTFLQPVLGGNTSMDFTGFFMSERILMKILEKMLFPQ